jgi:hypothetical protein
MPADRAIADQPGAGTHRLPGVSAALGSSVGAVVLRRVISVAAVAALVLVLSPQGALAQEGDPALVVQQAHPSSTSVHYYVKLAADGGDGAPIDGATVTATPTSPDGTAGQPIELEGDGEGIYQGAVGLSESGDWTVTFASTDPAATLTWDQTMPGEEFDVDDDGKDSSPMFPLLFAGAFLITLAGMGVWALIDRRRGTGTPDQPDQPEELDADPGIDDAAGAGADTGAQRSAAD